MEHLHKEKRVLINEESGRDEGGGGVSLRTRNEKNRREERKLRSA